MKIEILPVSGKRMLKSFIDFPHELYKDDQNYVPEIFIGQRELLNPKKNPFFNHSKVKLFIAKSGNRIVGRIAAIRNNNYNDYHQSNVGFFGMFDLVDDDEVANKLLSTAEDWCKSEALDEMIGPANLSSNDTMGLLIEGFDSPPVIMMTYNKKYYANLLQKNGYSKDMDLHAYKIPTDKVSRRTLAITERLEQRLTQKGITIRSLKKKDFKNEVKRIREIYNKAWEKNWGFVPATEEEFNHLADGLKLILDEELCYIAEHEGKNIGFVLALHDINQIMINVKRGRLFPTGIFKLLFGKKKIDLIRIITLGIVEEFRKLGIEAILYAKMIQYADKYKIRGGEASWILENNEMMIKGLENLDAKKYKTYRIYKKAL